MTKTRQNNMALVLRLMKIGLPPMMIDQIRHHYRKEIRKGEVLAVKKVNSEHFEIWTILPKS